MKVENIRILDDLDEIDIENDNIDVCVDAEDGYTYTLSFATPKHLEFLMEKEKMDYYGPGYPFIIVNKLTPEIIEQAVKAFAEEDGKYWVEAGGYWLEAGSGSWLKTYHFAGWQGAIDESIFDQLKAKRLKEIRESNKCEALDLMRETKCTLKDLVNKADLIYLVKNYRSGNKHSAIKIRAVPHTCLTELRTRSGNRIYLQKKTNLIEVVAICDKDKRQQFFSLRDLYPKENNGLD